MKIFVCYTTRGDHVDKEYLVKAYSHLHKFGEVFIDLLHNKSNDPQKRIEKEIESSNILLVINTENISYSKWVSFEIEKAKKLGLKIIFITKDELLKL